MKQNTILDSRLITDTLPYQNPYKIYDLKFIECGSYQQLYLYEKVKSKQNDKDDTTDLDLIKINNINSKSIKLDHKIKFVNQIDERNIIRSKLSCQRIAKSNMKCWKSFITLTFKDNLQNVDIANKRLHYFLTKIRRVKKDFKYLCIPEFQKRGAIHYHLLTNIECDSPIIPKRDLKHLYNRTTKSYKDLEYYDIKYWLDGFSSAEPITNEPQKVVGYISKYMTKDIDQRLFGCRRYFYSMNLEMPKSSYINTNNKRDIDFLNKKIQDKILIYHNIYKDKFDNKIIFLELK